MNRGKEPPLSSCEQKFILQAIKEAKRLDGREVYDYRRIQVTLGQSLGHVEVQLGRTRVLACVSCEVAAPRPSRPAEGTLFFNVELSPMASPAFEATGRPSAQTTEIGRILERCFKESRAVETESLCIVAGEKVWDIRVDLHVLDDCGNVIDCAAIAAITALKHFRRPDVTVIGEEATIHSVTERDPVPLSVHHMPLCFTFAFFFEGEYLLVDPTHEEERVMDGRLIVGMNIHREICALQMTGGVAILPEQVLRCTNIATVKCAEVTEVIKTALVPHQAGKKEFQSILKTRQPQETVAVPEVVALKDEEEEEEDEMDPEPEPQITKLGEGTVELGVGGRNTWQREDALKDFKSCFRSDSEEEVDKTPASDVKIKKKKKKRSSSGSAAPAVVVVAAEDASSSEEETMMVVTEKDIDSYARSKPETVSSEGSHLEAKASPRKQQAQEKGKAAKKPTSKQATPVKSAGTKTETKSITKRRKKK